MKRIAVIGGGIVGVTSAFYLSKEGLEVDLYDDPSKAQATKAAVGIICPWVSQRRNKLWYHLAQQGALFYTDRLLKDVPQQSFYESSGTLIVHPSKQDQLLKIANINKVGAPEMGQVSILDGEDLAQCLPPLIQVTSAISVSGGAQIDGGIYREDLLQEAQTIRLIEAKANVKGLQVNNKEYDAVVVAAGAWLNGVIEGYEFLVSPQKGQLVELMPTSPLPLFPVVMPQGEVDILRKRDGKLVIGASHENDKGFDTKRDLEVEKQLLEQAKTWIPDIDALEVSGYRIGTRAYTADYLPIFGELYDHVYVATGLGSSGLTTGPYIGYCIAQAILGNMTLDEAYSPHKIVKQ